MTFEIRTGSRIKNIKTEGIGGFNSFERCTYKIQGNLKKGEISFIYTGNGESKILRIRAKKEIALSYHSNHQHYLKSKFRQLFPLNFKSMTRQISPSLHN